MLIVLPSPGYISEGAFAIKYFKVSEMLFCEICVEIL